VTRRETQGHSLAGLGAAGLIVSLWLPWYTFRIPPAAIDYAEQLAKQFGALGPLISRGAQLASQLGPLHLSAWHAFSTTPAVLLVIGVIGGGLSALALTDRAAGAARLTMLASVVGVALSGYRIVDPPGQGDLLHPAWGIYLALAGAVAMLAGGALASSESAQPVADVTLPEVRLDLSGQGAAGAGLSGVRSVPPAP